MAISLYEGVKLGFIDFWTRKLRSLITIIGIVLGTMSIIVVLSIVNGLQAASLEWINESGGMQKISIFRNWGSQNELNQREHFIMREFEYIRANIPEVEAISATIPRYWSSMTNGQNMTGAFLFGVFPDYEIIEEWTVSEGRFINQFDIRNSNDVIVLGTTIKDELFGPRSAIGQFITVDGRRMRVIGIMERRFLDSTGLDFGGDNPLEYLNRYALIPITTILNKMGAADTISDISIRAFDINQALELVPILNQIVLDLRRQQPIFRVWSAAESAQDDEMNVMFKIIFYFISSISLLVGGIVIMNILLASIKERTREIGIRLTVGARQRDIFMQFLVQSVVITFLGGVLGVVSGVMILDYVSDFMKVPTLVDVSMIIVALCISVVVGLFFGIYPAIKASKLDPVKALRVD